MEPDIWISFSIRVYSSFTVKRPRLNGILFGFRRAEFSFTQTDQKSSLTGKRWNGMLCGCINSAHTFHHTCKHGVCKNKFFWRNMCHIAKGILWEKKYKNTTIHHEEPAWAIIGWRTNKWRSQLMNCVTSLDHRRMNLLSLCCLNVY